jgi:nucleoside-diphosphate-sugar epimerase
MIRSFGAAVVGVDQAAIAAMGDVLAGSGKPFVTVLGTLSLKPGQLGVEQDDPDAASFGAQRAESERAVLALARRGIRALVIRLPPTVHGAGDKAFAKMLIDRAKKNGASAYIGDGNSRWPAVHRLDAAHLLRLALEKGAAGARYHGVAEEGVATKAIAEAIGRKVEVPTVSKSGKAASQHFGWLASIFSVDNPASSAWTRGQLGWEPHQPGLIADLANY